MRKTPKGTKALARKLLGLYADPKTTENLVAHETALAELMGPKAAILVDGVIIASFHGETTKAKWVCVLERLTLDNQEELPLIDSLTYDPEEDDEEIP